MLCAAVKPASASAAHPTDLSTSLFSASHNLATVASLDAASSLQVLPTDLGAAPLSSISARKTKRKQAEVQCPTCNENFLINFTEDDAEDLPATTLDAVRSYVGEQLKVALEAYMLGREVLRQTPLGQTIEIYLVGRHCDDGTWLCGEEAWAKFWNNLCCCFVIGDHGGIPSSTQSVLGSRTPALSLTTLMPLHPVIPAGAELLGFSGLVSSAALAFNAVMLGCLRSGHCLGWTRAF